MNKRLTLARLVLAVISMAAEQAGIWAVLYLLLPEMGVKVHIWVIMVVMAAWFIIGIWLFIIGTRMLSKQAITGLSSMIGQKGKAAVRLAPDGMVKIKGELWSAVSPDSAIEPGENVIVTGEDGLKLHVRKAA